SRRSRHRGGRGRGRRGSGRSREAAAGEESTAPPDAPTAAAPVDAAPADTTSADTVPVDDALSQSDSAEDSPSSTRPQARSRSARGRSATRSTRGRSTGGPQTARRPLGGVSEETRRAITEGPPRRMMVTVGEKRTQIAVLEERTLVEHYVTRREDVSYVGNIYLGRVQNVLPGMEAAFVDIGKGRNGVLYAGEVNYDEADLEGELPRIEQTLKLGQSVLVQVTKDPMGTKGARLTQHLSIAGRYCVLAPGEEILGISRKLTDDERERLRKILKGLKPEGYGLIVRTAAEGATREQLEADVARLERIWDQVSARAERAKPLEAVYEEPGLVIRVIRDVFGSEYSQLTVDSEELATQVRTYLDDVSPEFVDKVSVHTGEDNVFDAYEITNQIRRALERKVWLKSGGYLIVEKTEAMWVIDVNTGKFVGERNLEETVLRNNIEAATEIARQLRLRDMGGIIVIDFVDMLVPANRDEVLKRFRRELARDKTKSRVMEISKLGLVQMTRKNVSQGLQESFTTRCDVCEGRGARIVESIV
ncbi:MAG: Rne/Rng family ribonuclease, partial [Actinomycetota bacterium]|nr:Rne/Rng family ribonuclease [Actinomycetota bacterium]